MFVGRKRPEYYRDLLIKADTGLHQQIGRKIQTLVPDGGRALDVGAGEGALCARLSDMGYVMTAIDVDRASFKCEGVEYQQIDFDKAGEFDAFVARNESRFDAVLGVEVIEHVEDQWNYVRKMMKLVKPSGVLLITTPNITSWLSRFSFFFRGKFYSFDEHGLTYGHISPISPWELNLILQRCGAQDIVLEAAGTLPAVYLVPNREILMNMFILPFRPFMRGLVDGYCVMATARKPPA
jgi:SAM-dependent methyltransferase